MLDRDTPPRGETASIPEPLDPVEDRCSRVAGKNEITVQRVGRSFLDGALNRDQRLGDDEATENPLPTDLRAAPSIKVDLECFEVEMGDKLGDDVGHRDTRIRDRRPDPVCPFRQAALLMQTLSMQREVQSFALFFGGDTKAAEKTHELQDDERSDDAPQTDRDDADDLDAELTEVAR